MTHLTVWKFDSPEGAQHSLERFSGLQKEHVITIVDAATVSWPKGKKRPRTRQAVNLPAVGGLDGAFWGLLFGMIFFVPLLGAAIGATWGALAGSLRDYGIDDSLVENIRAQVKEGTSALFLLSTNETPDRIAESFQGEPMKLIQSNLSREQETKLRELFGSTGA